MGRIDALRHEDDALAQFEALGDALSDHLDGFSSERVDGAAVGRFYEAERTLIRDGLLIACARSSQAGPRLLAPRSLYPAERLISALECAHARPANTRLGDMLEALAEREPRRWNELGERVGRLKRATRSWSSWPEPGDAQSALHALEGLSATWRGLTEALRARSRGGAIANFGATPRFTAPSTGGSPLTGACGG